MCTKSVDVSRVVTIFDTNVRRAKRTPPLIQSPYRLHAREVAFFTHSHCAVVLQRGRNMVFSAKGREGVVGMSPHSRWR